MRLAAAALRRAKDAADGDSGDVVVGASAGGRSSGRYECSSTVSQIIPSPARLTSSWRHAAVDK